MASIFLNLTALIGCGSTFETALER